MTAEPRRYVHLVATLWGCESKWLGTPGWLWPNLEQFFKESVLQTGFVWDQTGQYFVKFLDDGGFFSLLVTPAEKVAHLDLFTSKDKRVAETLMQRIAERLEATEVHHRVLVRGRHVKLASG